MEFTGAEIISHPKILDLDDITGPGNCSIPGETGDLSIDCALLRIRSYEDSESVSEKLRITKMNGETSRLLGKGFTYFMVPLMKRQAEDHPDIQVELAHSIPIIASIIKDSEKVEEWVVPVLCTLLSKGNIEVLKAVAKSVSEIINSKYDSQMGLLTASLELVHDEDELRKAAGLRIIRDIIDTIPTDICQYFLVPEIVCLTELNILTIKKLLAGCLPKLCRQIANREFVVKMFNLFKEFASNISWGVRWACAENLSEFFLLDEHLILDSYQDTLLALLKDASSTVKQITCHKLGFILASSKVQIRSDILEIFKDTSRASGINSDLQYYCAYYIPGIIENKGVEIWEELKSAYEYMATEGEYRTRKSLAASISVMAEALGPERAGVELLDIYQDMLLEYHPGKVTALSHMSAMCRAISSDKRMQFLPHIKILCRNFRNWRVRHVLATQLQDLVNLFTFEVASKVLFPVIVELCKDNFGKVRESAARALGKFILMSLDHEESTDLSAFALDDYRNRLVLAQAFEEAILHEAFPTEFESLFSNLCDDPVANIRIQCARNVEKALQNSNYWEQTGRLFSIDSDPDVSFEVNHIYKQPRGIKVLKPGVFSISPIVKSPPHRYIEGTCYEISSDAPTEFGVYHPQEESLYSIDINTLLLKNF